MVAIWRHRPSREAGPPHGVILVRRRRQGTPLRWVKAWNPVLTGGGHHVSGGWPTRVTLGGSCRAQARGWWTQAGRVKRSRCRRGSPLGASAYEIVKLAVVRAVEERLELAQGEGQDRPARVLRVPHPDDLTHPGNLDALAVGLRLGALAPGCPTEVRRLTQRAHVNSFAACRINLAEPSGSSAMARKRSNARIAPEMSFWLSG